ncbi:hypothetical protein [Blautia marasmi]|uniref:hypothetical protein n=1 Tax=Blautia marasmi TaxID=1917868 RepID=UPI003513B4CF
MISRRISHCKLCGTEIETKGTWFNQIFICQLSDWKVEKHLKKEHNMSWMTPRYKVKSVLIIVVGAILQLLMAALWVITLPVWALHEFCSLN